MHRVTAIPQVLEALQKKTVINGKTVRRNYVDVNGQTFVIRKGLVNYAALDDDLFHDLKDPKAAIAGLARCRPRPDVFTFSQRVPEVDRKYDYQSISESLAVLPISTYEHWWSKQVKGTTRNMVRKSQKAGVEVREAAFDDEFVRGMVGIFNETPVRQGRPFWHYGKSFETVKRDFSTFIFREYLIGAYLGEELIGFVMLANAGRFGILGQFISKMQHRDKATNNALIAKTVEVCVQRELPYLLYTDWRDTSLVDFKRYSGFQEMRLPRYWIPLTQKGVFALQLGVHHGWKTLVPASISDSLKKLRKSWYELRVR